MTAGPGGLVLHGLTGTPHSVAGMAAALAAEGFEIESPLLPGHGTVPEDLAERGWAHWTEAVEASYQRLAARSGPIVVAGLSMGGALGAQVAATHPDRVAGLVAVNPLVDPPAPEFRQVLEGFLAAGEPFLPGVGGDLADPDAVEDAYDRLPVAALLSMSHGLVELHRRLGDVTCPVLVMTSRQDGVVPVVSSDVLAAGVSGPVERVWLERSRHVATLDVDRDEIERRLVAFALRRCSDLGGAPEGQVKAAHHQHGQGVGR